MRKTKSVFWSDPIVVKEPKTRKKKPPKVDFTKLHNKHVNLVWDNGDVEQVFIYWVGKINVCAKSENRTLYVVCTKLGYQSKRDYNRDPKGGFHLELIKEEK